MKGILGRLVYKKIDNTENLKKICKAKVTPIIKNFGGKPLVRGGRRINVLRGRRISQEL